MNEPPKLYRINDAAALLAVSRSTIYQLIRTGQLEAVSVGATQRITASSIDAFIERGKAGARAA